MGAVVIVAAWSTFRGARGRVVAEGPDTVLVLLEGDKMPLQFARAEVAATSDARAA